MSLLKIPKAEEAGSPIPTKMRRAMHGPDKYKPWKGCNCFQCRLRNQSAQKNYKVKLTHRRFRREAKQRLHKGDYNHFTIGTGYRC